MTKDVTDDEENDESNESTEEEQEKNISRYGVTARYMAIMMRKSNFLMSSFQLYGRPMAYASEFGESFRPFVNPYFVNTMYGLSIFYVIAELNEYIFLFKCIINLI